MSLSVIFNGIELNDLIDVEYGLNLTDGADWKPELRALSGGNGSDFLKTSYGSKSITMPFRIKNEINSKFDKLQRTLNVSSAKRLSFGNLKNRYFVAIPSSKIDLIVEKNGFIARGTITWLIPDGVSHSTDIKLTTATLIDGILTANVYNGGSDVVWPTYRLKSTADNGWYGIVHAGGTLELGNRAETEGVDYQQNEILLNTTTFNEANWNRWIGTYTPDQRFNLSGTLGVTGSGLGRGLSLVSAGENTGFFNGGCIVYTLQADSDVNIGAKNFYCWWDSFFVAPRMGQTGVQDIVFWSENEQILRWTIVKADKSGNSARCQAFANNGNGMSQIYSNDFQADDGMYSNPFSSKRGQMDFLKEGENIRLFYNGKYQTFSSSYIKDKKITKISISIANYDKRTGSDYVGYNMIRKIQFHKFHVDKWVDVVNRYTTGSELVVDTESATINLNGLPANDEAVNPPLFAPLQPGDNQIEFYQSDWSQSVPEITVETKERYL